ncbi:MAG TPA: hypothetical protein VN785_12210 [Candidatus Angelobacter sp.]|nr:hypothetical protein [Candidatus Angelobacter sp.]
MKGIVSGIFDWGQHPLYSRGTLVEWGAGLLMVLILAFFWKTVVDRIE